MRSLHSGGNAVFMREEVKFSSLVTSRFSLLEDYLEIINTTFATVKQKCDSTRISDILTRNCICIQWPLKILFQIFDITKNTIRLLQKN